MTIQELQQQLYRAIAAGDQVTVTATACGRFTDEEVAPYRDYKGVGIECRACQKDLAARGIAMVIVSEEGQP